MAKIEIKAKNPNLSISIDMDDLCDVLAHLSMKERIYIINYILENYAGKESPLKALAEQRYKDTVKEVKVFKDLAANPDIPAKDAYRSVAEKYEKEEKIWKEIIELENKN